MTGCWPLAWLTDYGAQVRGGSEEYRHHGRNFDLPAILSRLSQNTLVSYRYQPLSMKYLRFLYLYLDILSHCFTAYLCSPNLSGNKNS